MSVEVLRTVAALMRQRARGAAPGPWHIAPCPLRHGITPDVHGARMAPVACVDGRDESLPGVTAHHIASWSPPVALAVADLLDLAATHEKRTGDDCGQGYGPGGRYGYIDPSCSVCGTPDEYAAPWPCEYVKRGMALARAYLGGES